MVAGVCDDYEVVRITDKITGGQGRSLTERIVLGILAAIWESGFLIFPLFGNPFVHHIQIYVCQKWADKPALWCPVLVYLAFIHNPGFQHGLDNLQNPPVPHTHMI